MTSRLPSKNSEMIRRELELATGHGSMPLYLVQPDPAAVGPAPAVIVFMDAPGIRLELLQMAARIAGEGFCCVVPDLYYRLGRIRLDLTHRSEAHGTVYRALASTLVNSEVFGDTSAVCDFLRVFPEVKHPLIGCVGFSVGGRFAVQAAGLLPDQVAVAVSICGTAIVTDRPDSPHRLLPATNARIVLDFAEHDPAVSPEVITTLHSVLATAKAKFHITVEPGTHHGYIFPSRPMYDAVSAENTWRRTFDALKALLVASSD
jgi:carboxymethylenebutenolidase